MRSILVVLCALALVNCSNGDGNGGAGADATMRGTFTAESETQKTYFESACPSGVVGDMDARLKAGMMFTTVSVYKDFEDSSLVQTIDQLNIQTIDHDQNFFVGKHTISSPVDGWYIGKTQFSFSPGMDYSKMDIISVSPNLVPLWKASKQEDDAPYENEWTSCYVKNFGNQEIKNEDGTFTFANGTAVKAQRQVRTQKGPIECIRMQHVEGQAPKELSRTDMGDGAMTDIEIHSMDVPTTDVSCGGKLSRLYNKRETTLDTSEILIFDSEELTQFR